MGPIHYALSWFAAYLELRCSLDVQLAQSWSHGLVHALGNARKEQYLTVGGWIFLRAFSLPELHRQSAFEAYALSAPQGHLEQQWEERRPKGCRKASQKFPWDLVGPWRFACFGRSHHPLKVRGPGHLPDFGRRGPIMLSSCRPEQLPWQGR